MAFSALMTAALSGASLRQLGHWRRTGVLVPEVSAERPIHYSFRDIVALRSCVYLRQDTSLQKIRAAIFSLRDLGEVEHLSRYRLVSFEGTVALDRGDEVIDLVKHRHNTFILNMSTVLGEFSNESGDAVPDLRRPRPHVAVDPAMRGGHPVIKGTRIPYELVAGLIADGVPAADVRLYYPGVNADAARDAHTFADYVASYDERQPVA